MKEFYPDGKMPLIEYRKRVRTNIFRAHACYIYSWPFLFIYLFIYSIFRQVVIRLF